MKSTVSIKIVCEQLFSGRFWAILAGKKSFDIRQKPAYIRPCYDEKEQTMSITDKAVTEVLEALIDAHGLLHVITGLELVCGEKSEHVLSNWQDRVTAKTWARASLACGRLARDPAINAVS